MDAIETLEPWGYKQIADAVESWAKDDAEIRAMFVGGSIAQGTSDRFSDLDLVLVAPASAFERLTGEVRDRIEGMWPVIIENRLRPGDLAILSVVTDQWHRVDVAFGDMESDILRQRLVTVFDPEELYQGPPEEVAPPPVTPAHVITLAKDFLRILGLAVVVNGRNDVHAAHDGANLLRTLLIELLLMEPPRRLRPGPKTLLPVLSDEQHGILRSLPPVADDLALLDVFNEATAKAFLPRARVLVESLGGQWPVEVEEATRAYLENGGQG